MSEAVKHTCLLISIIVFTSCSRSSSRPERSDAFEQVQVSAPAYQRFSQAPVRSAFRYVGKELERKSGRTSKRRIKRAGRSSKHSRSPIKTELTVPRPITRAPQAAQGPVASVKEQHDRPHAWTEDRLPGHLHKRAALAQHKQGGRTAADVEALLHGETLFFPELPRAWCAIPLGANERPRPAVQCGISASPEQPPQN